MSGNLPFSHETVVHSLMREAVAWSQTIRNRICFMVKLNHTAYWRMAIQAQTNSSIPLKIWDHPLQCQHFVRYVSVEQYFSAAVLLSVSESWSPLTLPLPQKALVVSHPVRAWTPNRSSERQQWWLRHYWDSWAIMLRKETLKNGPKHKRTQLTGLTSLREGHVCTRRSQIDSSN